jgi:hypothetical protein
MASLPLIACTLSADGQRGRLADWRALLATATSRTAIAGGARYAFEAGDAAEARVRRLAAAEQDCCSFFDLAVERSGESIELRVTAPAEAHDALRFLFPS